MNKVVNGVNELGFLSPWAATIRLKDSGSFGHQCGAVIIGVKVLYNLGAVIKIFNNNEREKVAANGCSLHHWNEIFRFEFQKLSGGEFPHFRRKI